MQLLFRRRVVTGSPVDSLKTSLSLLEGDVARRARFYFQDPSNPERKNSPAHQRRFLDFVALEGECPLVRIIVSQVVSGCF
jgi:hypothetical protein